MSGYQENYELKKKNQDLVLAPEKITEIFYVPNNSKKKKFFVVTSMIL